MPSMPSARPYRLLARRGVACLHRGDRIGLPVKLHAEQLSNQGGAALAASFGALSADHLEYLDETGIAAGMARAGTVAVLLPFAFYFLRDRQAPPIEALRRAGVPVALATDCNPGSSPVTSLLLVLNMGGDAFRHARRGVHPRRHPPRGAGARPARRRPARIEVGKSCDLAIWDVERPAELVYRIGFNPLHRRVWRGR